MRSTSNSKILVKIHESQGRKIIAVCDKELVGKKFEEGEFCLDISYRFYGGEEMGEEEIIEILKDATNVNAVGENSVSLICKIFDGCGVIRICNIPHVQIFEL